MSRRKGIPKGGGRGAKLGWRRGLGVGSWERTTANRNSPGNVVQCEFKMDGLAYLLFDTRTPRNERAGAAKNPQC
jgi:hypothetical protein